jgi:hypothetical protein
MLMHETTWYTFEQCVASAKVPWTAAWDHSSEVDGILMGTIIGIWAACLLLFVSRCLVAK